MTIEPLQGAFKTTNKGDQYEHTQQHAACPLFSSPCFGPHVPLAWPVEPEHGHLSQLWNVRPSNQPGSLPHPPTAAAWPPCSSHTWPFSSPARPLSPTPTIHVPMGCHCGQRRLLSLPESVCNGALRGVGGGACSRHEPWNAPPPPADPPTPRGDR